MGFCPCIENFDHKKHLLMKQPPKINSSGKDCPLLQTQYNAHVIYDYGISELDVYTTGWPAIDAK
jgi:hypothetical protein